MLGWAFVRVHLEIMVGVYLLRINPNAVILSV